MTEHRVLRLEKGSLNVQGDRRDLAGLRGCSAPASFTICGVQWPPGNIGSIHSSMATCMTQTLLCAISGKAASPIPCPLSCLRATYRYSLVQPQHRHSRQHVIQSPQATTAEVIGERRRPSTELLSVVPLPARLLLPRQSAFSCRQPQIRHSVACRLPGPL